MSNTKISIPSLCSVLGVCLLFCLTTSCSRPKKPEAVQKKAQTNEIAPMPQSATKTVKIVRKDDQSLPPNPSASTPETNWALLERRKNFVKKSIVEELQKKERDMEEVTSQLQGIASNAGSIEAVKAASQNLADRRNAYDQERSKLPGMLDLYKKREAEKDLLIRLKAQSATPEHDQTIEEAQKEINALGLQMMAIEQGGRTNIVSFQQSVEAMLTAEAGREASLMAIPEFEKLALKLQKLQEEHSHLLKQQAALAMEEKK